MNTPRRYRAGDGRQNRLPLRVRLFAIAGMLLPILWTVGVVMQLRSGSAPWDHVPMPFFCLGVYILALGCVSSMGMLCRRDWGRRGIIYALWLFLGTVVLRGVYSLFFESPPSARRWPLFFILSAVVIVFTCSLVYGVLYCVVKYLSRPDIKAIFRSSAVPGVTHDSIQTRKHEESNRG